MALLSELKTKDLIKALVYGEPGCGKTIFACGFPGPILYLDFDNKISSAARFFESDKQRLESIEVVRLAPSVCAAPWATYAEHINKIDADLREGKCFYKTVVLDSLTTFSTAVMREIITSNPAIKRNVFKQGVQPSRDDYGILLRRFIEEIPKLINLDINVVMLGHLEIDKDETTGEVLRSVMMDGSFSQKLPIYFEEVYHAYVEEKDGKRKYLAQTQSDSKFKKCRSQIPRLPSIIELKYEELTRKR